MTFAPKLYTHAIHRPGVPARITARNVGDKRNMVTLTYADNSTYDAYEDLLKPYESSPLKVPQDLADALTALALMYEVHCEPSNNPSMGDTMHADELAGRVLERYTPDRNVALRGRYNEQAGGPVLPMAWSVKP